jgi:hypothetical protein
VFVPGALPPADFEVGVTGEFAGVTDKTNVFAAHLLARTEQLIRTAAPSADGADGLTDQAVHRSTVTMSPGAIEGSTAENYQLETAMWIGASLEQGVWYETVAPLSLAGLPGVVIPHRMEFVFTRMVRCTPAAEPSCAEMVIRATPEQQALDQLIEDTGIAAYSASSDFRIVTDPATLLPYAREERHYWYASRSNGIRGSDLGSEHLVSTVSYAADSAASGGRVSSRESGPP